MFSKIKEITVTELKQWQDEGKDFQLIDVREKHEKDIADIGGELIPLGKIMENINKISKEKPVILYCRSGARSGNAVAGLNKHGFDNLSNLKGGIIAWSNEIDPSIQKY